MAQNEIAELVRTILVDVPEVRGVVIGRADGSVIYSTLPAAEAGGLAVMSASLLAVALRASSIAGMAAPDEMSVRTQDGSLAYARLGNAGILCVLGSQDLKVGLLNVVLRRIGDRLTQQLGRAT